MSEIEIRPMQSMAEMQDIEELQLAIWGKDEREMMPGHLCHALQHNGAALLGAFDGSKLIGFTLAVLATVEGLTDRIDQVAAARLKMYSVIAGVLPEYRDGVVGYMLKMAQIDFALRIGVRLITWTFDPLESRNGRFNIAKLGAICHRYLRNFHGEMVGINAGLETDRFEVEWWVTSNRAKGRANRPRQPLPLQALLDGGAVLVNEVIFNADGLPVPPANYVSRPGNLMLVEIPADFQEVKRRDFPLALRWRRHSRTLFEGLFHSGFVVTDFVAYTDENEHRRSFYLLTFQDA
jgi:predicted GNAT superfamily acetyltransferase